MAILLLTMAIFLALLRLNALGNAIIGALMVGCVVVIGTVIAAELEQLH